MAAPQMRRDELCALIVAQLQYYGLHALAATVAEGCNVPRSAVPEPSSQLAELTYRGQGHIVTPAAATASNPGTSNATSEAHRISTIEVDPIDPELLGEHLQWRPGQMAVSSIPEIETAFLATHKGNVLAITFSSDAKFAASAAADTSIKLMDPGRMLNPLAPSASGDPSDKPVLRSYYDHTASVNDVVFHPNGQVLASASDDMTVRLFDVTKSTMRRCFKTFQDAAAVHSLDFHPSGDYLLAATDHDVLRLYDVRSGNCFNGSARETHSGGILCVRYSPTGSLYATGGVDGTIRFWHGSTALPLRTMPNVHGGAPVVSMRFSKSGKYLLTHGRDGVPKLWDVASGRLFMSYDGAPSKLGTQITFDMHEKYVLAGDDNSNVVCWCARTGRLLLKQGGHNGPVHAVCVSPIDNSLFSGSEDNRVRLWTLK